MIGTHCPWDEDCTILCYHHTGQCTKRSLHTLNLYLTQIEILLIVRGMPYSDISSFEVTGTNVNAGLGRHVHLVVKNTGLS